MKRLKLEDGSRFTIGSTEIAFTGSCIVLASAQVETTLLALKIAFLVLLYLFIWRIVRSAARDLRLPQESMILGPQQAAARPHSPPSARELGRLVVLASPTLGDGRRDRARLASITLGRGRTNDIAIGGGRVRVDATCTLRAAPRRRLGRGRRLDERHVRERQPPDARAPARARRRHPRRRDRAEVRAVRIGPDASATHAGRKRRHNEDAFVVRPPLFAIADGMGGAQRGRDRLRARGRRTRASADARAAAARSASSS